MDPLPERGLKPFTSLSLKISCGLITFEGYYLFPANFLSRELRVALALWLRPLQRQDRLPRGRLQAKIAEPLKRELAAARRTLHKPHLQDIRLHHILKRPRLLADGGR